MDQLLLENHALLIKIKGEYDKLLLENDELKKQINFFKLTISLQILKSYIHYLLIAPAYIVLGFLA